MNTVAMVCAFLSMPGCINLTLLSFLWNRESDKKQAGERIRAAVAEYAAKISKDDQDAWMRFIIQVTELDQLLGIGLAAIAKEKIRDAYADMFEDCGDINWVANWITMLVEIELRKAPGDKPKE